MASGQMTTRTPHFIFVKTDTHDTLGCIGIFVKTDTPDIPGCVGKSSSDGGCGRLDPCVLEMVRQYPHAS